MIGSLLVNGKRTTTYAFNRLSQATLMLDETNYDYFIPIDEIDKATFVHSGSYFTYQENRSLTVTVKKGLELIRVEKANTLAFRNSTSGGVEIYKLKFHELEEYGNVTLGLSWESALSPEIKSEDQLPNLVYKPIQNNRYGTSIKNAYMTIPIIGEIIASSSVLEKIVDTSPELTVNVVDGIKRSTNNERVWNETALAKNGDYYYPKSNRVVLADHDTMVADPDFDEENIPWMLVINHGRRSVIVHLNTKHYGADAEVVKTLMGADKVVKLTKADVMNIIATISVLESNYADRLRDATIKYFGDGNGPVIITDENGKFVSFGLINRFTIEQLVINEIQSFLSDKDIADLPPFAQAMVQTRIRVF